MSTVKVPDLADGPVTIRLSGSEPVEFTAKGGQISCKPEQVPTVLAAFAGAEVTDAKTKEA